MQFVRHVKLTIPRKLTPSFEKVQRAIERDDFYSANLKKLAVDDFFRAKLDYDSRLLLRFVAFGGRRACLALEVIEHRAYGRLFAWDPKLRESRVVTDGLYFANGVALAADESFVLVAETTCYRVSRVWLSGPRAGQRDVFVDNLPGFPDNLSRGPSGLFWIALPNPRNRALDLLLPMPRIRWAVANLPERLQPQEVRYGLVVATDDSGRVVRALHDPTGRVAFITGVREHEGSLYLSSLDERHLARVPL